MKVYEGWKQNSSYSLTWYWMEVMAYIHILITLPKLDAPQNQSGCCDSEREEPSCGGPIMQCKRDSQFTDGAIPVPCPLFYFVLYEPTNIHSLRTELDCFCLFFFKYIFHMCYKPNLASSLSEIMLNGVTCS